MRQTNIVLLAAVPILLFGVTWSAKKAGAVTLGILAVIAGLLCLNAWRTNQLGLWAEGGWYAEFPMFTHGLFRPDNGPASQRLESHLQHCEIAYNDIRMPGGTVNQWQLESCLKREEALWIIAHERAAVPAFFTTETVACLDRMGGQPSREQAIQCVDDIYKDAIERCLTIQDWYYSQKCISREHE